MALAWRLLWRDARHGEVWLLLAALILAVASTTSLRFFSTSLEQGLTRQAASLIAADLVLASSRPLRPEVRQQAAALGLRQAELSEFSSMVQHGEDFQLAAVKAVSSGYPLRGQLQARNAGGPLLPAGIPQPGTVWLDERLCGLLRVGPGDEVQIGELSLRVAAVLTREPDRGGNFSAFAPRALMHQDDVGPAGIIQPGSRVQYRLLLAGPAAAIARYTDTIRPGLATGERLLDVAGGRPEIGTPLTRASDYLSLAAIAAVVLAGVAVALTARRYGERHYDAIALMRCLGARQASVQGLYARQLALIWLAAVTLGGLLGALASRLLFVLLQDLLPTADLGFAWQRPLLTGIATATLTLTGFALPAFIALFRVSPLRVLRREMAPASLPLLAVTALALAALFLLLTLETGNWRLTLITVAGGAALTGLIGLLLRWLLGLLRRRLDGRSLGGWAAGLRELWRHPTATVTQLLGFAIGITAMLLVTSLRGELISAWQGKLPADAPNQFALGIPAPELADFQAALSAAGLRDAGYYPVIRGRLTAINERPVQQAVSKDSAGEPDEALNRELNLTTSATLPVSNQLLAGAWWPASVSGPLWPVSLESRLAERLQIRIGDRLRFTLAEGELDARVTSLRKVDWDSFQPNFYMVFPPAALAPFPATYLTGFHVPADRREVLNPLVQRFPTMVLIDVDAVMTQVRSLLDQVSLAVEFVLVFVLVAGVLVLLACVAASLDQRRREAALLRALGASKRQLQRRLGSEMLLLGLLSGLIAVLLTELIAAALYVSVLDLPPVPHYALWLLTPLLGALLTGAAGLLGARRVWTVAPVVVLREN